MKFLDLQVGSVSMASIDKDGDTILQGTLSINGALTTVGDAVGDALTFNAGTWMQ